MREKMPNIAYLDIIAVQSKYVLKQLKHNNITILPAYNKT